LGVYLDSEVEIELLKSGPRMLEYPQDVVSANPDFLSGPASKDWETDRKLEIEQTDEFRHALAALGNPRDVFREANPNDFGADFSPAVREMLNLEESRTQHLLAFDRVSGGASLLKMAPVHCSRITLMGDSGAMTDFLSWTPGVEVVLAPEVVDDFTLM